MMPQEDYDQILELAVENGKMLYSEHTKMFWDEEHDWHLKHFDSVLSDIDERPAYGHLSKYEAKQISEICGDVQNDMMHSDILGCFSREDIE